MPALPDILLSLRVDQSAPQGGLSITVSSDGSVSLARAEAGPAQVRPLSGPEMEAACSRLGALHIADWPSNGDCGCGFTASWKLSINWGNLRKTCYGTCGFEPDEWADLMRLLEELCGTPIA